MQIKPSDISTKEHFWNSPLQEHNKEVILKNIIYILNVKNPNEFEDFSLEEYQSLIKHNYHRIEGDIIRELVKYNALSEKDGHYSVTDWCKDWLFKKYPKE